MNLTQIPCNFRFDGVLGFWGRLRVDGPSFRLGSGGAVFLSGANQPWLDYGASRQKPPLPSTRARETPYRFETIVVDFPLDFGTAV